MGPAPPLAAGLAVWGVRSSAIWGHAGHAAPIIYRAAKRDCDDCPLKPRCCPNTPARKIARSVHEDARDYARMIGQTKAFEQSAKDRKKVEITFAHMKRIIGLKRFRLRGMTGARDELLLAATALNLRKLAKMIWRPPMMGAACPA